jgi:hypothetical protein
MQQTLKVQGNQEKLKPLVKCNNPDLENMPADKDDKSNKKDDNGYLIDTMHHFQIYICWTGRIFLPEKVTCHLPKVKVVFKRIFFLIHNAFNNNFRLPVQTSCHHLLLFQLIHPVLFR